ncbi:MAG: proline iminopeptidase-family hydrolase [Flavobacteriaceae bacterium]|tara:strand:- start:59 stop:1072 length:1014 start_codon:yes stop_codon:yes gene_type:complete
MFKKILFLLSLLTISCGQNLDSTNKYLDYSSRDDKLSGGVKMIEIETPSGKFNVWTKRVGNNPTKKVLLLHGGPGANHEYFQAIDSYFPKESIEYYYYDQLGSSFSDKPKDQSLWTIDRFVDEVEQVRLALGLDENNFIILGHSWGGILGLEYALKHQNRMKALIISNMVPSIPDYIKYANDVLAPKLDPSVLKKIREYENAGDYTNNEYLGLIEEHYYPKHVLRMPLEEWPNPVTRSLAGLNYDIYLKMQGPSEFGVVGDALLKEWDRKNDLKNLKIPVLTIGGQHDTMDPKQMEWMSTEVQNGTYLHCPNGSHWSMYDDQETYFNGVTEYINSLP